MAQKTNNYKLVYAIRAFVLSKKIYMFLGNARPTVGRHVDEIVFVTIPMFLRLGRGLRDVRDVLRCLLSQNWE